MAAGPTLEEAVRLHQAGKLSEANDLYRAILDREPDNANALHLSGAVALQQDLQIMLLFTMVEPPRALQKDTNTIQKGQREIKSLFRHPF